MGEASGADVGDEEGAVPLDAEHAPRDGHRIHAAVGSGGDGYAAAEGFQDLAVMLI